MRTTSLLALVACLHWHIVRSRPGPSRGTGQVLLGEVDIAVPEETGLLETTTEEDFIRKCFVDGKSYLHSQTIPSLDKNSHCLCVAGEVYCWWQNYHPASEQASPEAADSTGSTDVADDSEASGEPEQIADAPLPANNQTRPAHTSQPTPVTCLVMGREYREGEVLPHSTGNCIECSCGSEGWVECSPRDCVALRPEVPEPPETSDTDFEVFNLARDRGIDESF